MENITEKKITEEQRYYWYISLGITNIDTSRRFSNKIEAKAASDKIISRIYRSAEKLFVPGNDSLAAEYATKYAIRIFCKYFPNPDTEEELPEKLRTLLNNTSTYFRNALDKELLESADYYRLYTKSYFLDRVDIEEHDYTVDTGNSGFFNALFRLVSPDKDYTIENLIETVMELEEDVNRRADTFSKAAFAVYQRYCAMLDKTNEEAAASSQG